MLEQCDGYKSLLAAVEKDHDPKKERQFHDYRGTLQWAIDRAKHYAEKTGLTAEEILNAWEKKRNYWHMNYYQEANQPEIQGDSVRVFDDVESLRESIGKDGFRCPYCKGVSSSPSVCDSGKQVQLLDENRTAGTCNWKVGGLFGHLGKGVYVFVKSEVAGESLFMPIAWETSNEPVPV